MGRKLSSKVPAFVDALVATGIRRLISKLPTNEDEAAAAMQDIAGAICSQWQKTILYVPVYAETERIKRDDSIRAKYRQDSPSGAVRFTPDRVAELATEFALTVAHVYCIVRIGRPSGAAVMRAAPEPTARSVLAWPMKHPTGLVGSDSSR